MAHGYSRDPADYDLNSTREFALERKWAKDAREPVVALVRVVRDEDRREMLALNFASAFRAVAK